MRVGTVHSNQKLSLSPNPTFGFRETAANPNPETWDFTYLLVCKIGFGNPDGVLEKLGLAWRG